jgi:hypothetical protein
MVFGKQTYMLLIALLMLFLQCSSPGGGGEELAGNTKATIECRSDADCASGKACYTELGICLDVAPEGLAFSVYVEPEAGAGFLPVVFDNAKTDAQGAIDLQVPAPIEIKGVCAFAPENPDQAVLELVGGRIIAATPTSICGMALKSEARVSDRQEVGHDWTFSLFVLPHVPYTLTFLPDERPNSVDLTALPTFVSAGVFDEPVTNYRFLLPSKQAYIASTIVGVVTFDTEGLLPVQNAVVTGFAGGIKGTKAVTDSQGRFKVVLPPDEWGLTLRVEPVAKDATFVGREFYYDALPKDLRTVRLVLGEQPQKYRLLVHVYGVSGQDIVPVPLAGVIAERVGQGEIGYQASVTGKDGVAPMTLFAGSYRVVVTSPMDSPFATKEFMVNVSSDNQVFHAQLPKRSVVKGVVASVDENTPVSSAVVTVQTNSLFALSGEPSSAPEVSTTVVTDENGAFSVMLDPGRYAVTVVPPAGSKLARFSQPLLEVGEEDLFLKISLPKGVLVKGKVRSAVDGVPLPTAQVQFYFKVGAQGGYSGTWSLQDSAFGQVVQLAGFTKSDNLGQFQVMLPPINAERSEPRFTGADNGGEPASFGLPGIEVQKM